MRKRNIFYISFFLGFIFLVFRNWFFVPQIIGGDWPYYFPEMLRGPSVYFSSWNPGQGNGLGGVSPLYFLSVFFGFTVFLSHTFNIQWVFIYKFFWFLLPLFFGILSSIYLVKKILPKSALWQQLFSSLIFTTNTYFVMVAGGGQMGIALAYSVAPLVLGVFIKIINLISSSDFNSKFKIQNLKFSIVAGLALSLQVLFDPRIAYLTMIAVVLYLVLGIKKNIFTTFLPLEALAKWGYLLLYTLVLPVGIAVFLHAFWFLPVLLANSSPIPQELFSAEGFRFFSFADFSHTFSLLHPNWPENIFGKIYFLQPEFILLPILAYSSLLFISKIKNQDTRTILFFALLGIIGTFLAKGSNEPLGQINKWLFENFPGMNLFRDPTKFYLLIALSYSALIPFSVSSIYNGLNSKLQLKIQKYLPGLFLIFTVCYLLFLLRPALLGQLSGTFQKREVPLEYVKLKDFLYRQPGFFRTLWVPRQSRFTYNFWGRMPVEAEPLLKRTKIKDIISELNKAETREYLSDLGIKYVIVPYDPYGEIFVNDRKYDDSLYLQTVRQLQNIPWLKKIEGFGKIMVFETPSFRDYLWLSGRGNLTYKMVSPSEYRVILNISRPAKLNFSENYHPDWVSKVNDTIIHSQKAKNGINSFQLDRIGRYTVDVIFSQETFYGYGRIISLAAFSVAALFLFLKKKIY